MTQAPGWIGRHRRILAIGIAGALLVAIGAVVVVRRLTGRKVYDDLYDGRLVAADYYTDRPEILSAGLGFVGIIGVPSLDRESVRAAGGAWAGHRRRRPERGT